MLEVLSKCFGLMLKQCFKYLTSLVPWSGFTLNINSSLTLEFQCPNCRIAKRHYDTCDPIINKMADDAISEACRYLGYKILKRESVKAFVEGRDVFVMLLTGFGKSLCYSCSFLPAIFNDDVYNDTFLRSTIVWLRETS